MRFRSAFSVSGSTLVFVLMCAMAAWSQSGSRDIATTDSQGLQQQIDELKAELKDVRRELDSTRAQLASLAPQPQKDEQITGAAADPASKDANLNEPVEDKIGLLSSKINEEYQTKLESSSRYRVRFSGLLLLNLFANRGNVDTIENPSLALDIDPVTRLRGSIGGTLRQTELGFQVFGPTMFGAHSTGNVQFDFSGGLAPTPGGETMGIVRMRTGTVRLDWAQTSLVAGQDGLFFYPLSPTSYASLNQPPLAYAGNLWGWIPQVRVERRFGAPFASTVTVQAGILDPITAQVPDNTSSARPAGPGEQSRVPGVGAHAGWARPLFGRTLSIGLGGYHGRQQYQILERPTDPPSNVGSWLGSADWDIPFTHWLSLSGSLYRGSALGGLGGGLGQSIVLLNALINDPNPPANALVRGLNTEGGWSQLKIRPVQKLEWNFAVGDDNPFARQLDFAAAPTYLETPLERNRAAFGNVIYRPRSDLLFALEFRHVQSFPIADKPVSANQMNLGMGIYF
jgi:hypothetical protein